MHLRSVAKSFTEAGAERVVLHDLSAEVERGECVALVGRSGSGKSTLLNLIGGIDQPTSGEVEVEGVVINLLDEQRRTLFRRARIGFVFQFFNLIPTLTAQENLLLPLELQGRLDRDSRAGTLALLDEVGLSDRAAAFPDRLSGGEQQRVAIARALSADPALVLADEPTGNLDADTGQLVLEMLDRLVRARGRTLILATHSRAVAGRADRLLTVRDGRLEESRTVPDRASGG